MLLLGGGIHFHCSAGTLLEEPGLCWVKFTLASYDSNRKGEMPQHVLGEEAAVVCGLIHVPAEAADLDLSLLVLLIPSCSRSGACVGAVLRPGALPFPCTTLPCQSNSSLPQRVLSAQIEEAVAVLQAHQATETSHKGGAAAFLQ